MWRKERTLAGDGARSGGVLVFVVGGALGFGQVEVALQQVEHGAGQFAFSLVLLGVGPVAIQANGIGDVFGKRLAVAAFAGQNLA